MVTPKNVFVLVWTCAAITLPVDVFCHVTMASSSAVLVSPPTSGWRFACAPTAIASSVQLSPPVAASMTRATSLSTRRVPSPRVTNAMLPKSSAQ